MTVFDGRLRLRDLPTIALIAGVAYFCSGCASTGDKLRHRTPTDVPTMQERMDQELNHKFAPRCKKNGLVETLRGGYFNSH